MNNLYQYIKEWEDKPYFDEFKTLVDMAYELETRYKDSKITLKESVEEKVRREFRELKIAIKDASENYCPGTTVPETSKTILSTLVIWEKFLNHKLKN